jgi:hypothetical protein
MTIGPTFQTLAIANGDPHGIESELDILGVRALDGSIFQDGETLRLLVHGEL